MHIHDWNTHNPGMQRTVMLLDWFRRLVLKANKEKAKVLIAGDLFHNPSHISNELLSLVVDYFQDIECKVVEPIDTVYCITGNHDRDGDDPMKSPSYVRTFSNMFHFFQCLDFRHVELRGYSLCGIPYLKGDVGLENAMGVFSRTKHDLPRILVIHKELVGAEDTNGMKCAINGDQSKITSFFKDFDYVVCGHIHKPQLLRKNILMCGSPMHMRVCDMGTDMGLWVLDKDGFHFEVADLPQFRYEGDPGKNFDVYIKKKLVKTNLGKEVKKEVVLSNLDKVVDDYVDHVGESRKKRVKLVKDILKDAELS